MEITILSYRGGRKTRKMNQAIAVVSGVSSKEEASKLIGKKVVIKFKKSSIVGVINRTHGDNGRVIIRFRRGLPGESFPTKLSIN